MLRPGYGECQGYKVVSARDISVAESARGGEGGFARHRAVTRTSGEAGQVVTSASARLPPDLFREVLETPGGRGLMPTFSSGLGSANPLGQDGHHRDRDDRDRPPGQLPRHRPHPVIPVSRRDRRMRPRSATGRAGPSCQPGDKGRVITATDTGHCASYVGRGQPIPADHKTGSRATGCPGRCCLGTARDPARRSAFGAPALRFRQQNCGRGAA